MLTDPTLEAPQRMIEWSRTAATLLRAVGRAYPRGAPAEVKAAADRVCKLASRGAVLQGTLEAHAKALERFVQAGMALHAEVRRKMEAASDKTQLAAYEAAYEQDLAAGRELIATRTREALACEKDFTEGCGALLAFLRDNRACRDVLEDIRLRDDITRP